MSETNVSKWSDAWLVCDDNVDRQHQQIFSIYLEIQNHNNGDISEQIRLLLGLMNQHFETEEKILRSTNYPLLRKHVEHHNEFARDFSVLVCKFKQSLLAADEVAHFLQRWLVEHLIVEDMAFFSWKKKYSESCLNDKDF